MNRGNERWRRAVDFADYEVSDRGRVRLDGHVLQQGWSNGYKTVSLVRNGRRKPISVAALVLTAFVGPRPPGLLACHGNDVKADNRLSNLRWDTPAANARDAITNGGMRPVVPRRSEANVWMRLRDPERLRQRMRERRMSQVAVASAAKVHPSFVSHLLPPAHSPGTRPRRRHCTPDTAARLAYALGCETSVLFELRGPDDPSTGPIPVETA